MKKEIKPKTKEEILKEKKKKEIAKFKQKYFEYYDDVKSPSKGREDW